MKYIKTFENKEVTENEINKLFQELKYHDEKHREIDSKLANICKSKIEPFLDKLEPFEIKKMYYKFYKNIYSNDSEDSNDSVDFSFEKDMVLMWINKELKLREEEKKYNL